MKEVVLTVVKLLIPMILQALRSLLTNERFVVLGDKVLDLCERWITAEPDWYDEYLMELVKIVREAAAIPDLPDTP